MAEKLKVMGCVGIRFLSLTSCYFVESQGMLRKNNYIVDDDVALLACSQQGTTTGTLAYIEIAS